MRLKLSVEVFTIGNFILGFFLAMKVHKKLIAWLFVGVCVASVIVAFWPPSYEQQTKSKHTRAAVTYGNNSPAVNLSGVASGSNATVIQPAPNSTTIIGSVNQQGGQTFQIIIANGAGVSVPKLTGTYVSKNVPNGERFITSAILHLDSPYPVGALTVEAYGKGVERVTLGFADSMFTSGERFFGKNSAGFRLRNAYGDIRLLIDSTTPEEFQLTAKIN